MSKASVVPETVVRPAATVILVRENKGAAFEIFLMRRHKKQSFMGGAFVFPGGAQDPSDTALNLDNSIKESPFLESLEQLERAGISQEKAKGLFVTALRETFEESGVLFAKTDKQATLKETVSDDSLMSEIRKKVHAGTLALSDLSKTQNLIFTPECLIPYARWITPDIENKRFDTLFFIAKIPKKQIPTHDDIELVDSMWVSPETALEQNSAKQILLMPPTVKTIQELSFYASTDDLLEAAKRKMISPILPQAISAELGFGMKLPHDPEYTIKEYKQDFRPDEPSRIMMIDGNWTPMFAGKQ